jgi:hypothetical protein
LPACERLIRNCEFWFSVAAASSPR